jgi:hypothetical protein
MKTFLIAILLFLPSLDLAQNAKAADHAGAVDSRGDHAMGFSHEKTAHHFTLLPDGGIIAVEADSKTDAASRDQIRMHLTHIARLFVANDFDVPMFIHDKVPPGVPVMKQKRKAISYVFEPTASGGQVRITTRDAEAVKAVHEFLRFQIEDHRTGDAMTVKAPA